MTNDQEFSWIDAVREESRRNREEKRAKRRTSGRILFKRLVELGALDPDADAQKGKGK
ncbi:MAG: hypothetical protein M5U26_14380 [Planctomycetota bacterium]|nr:hypothetical protein [Planctomycetota bacterium]